MYGAESVIVNLCRWFDAEGHRSSVAVFLNHSNPNLELYWNCRQLGIESHQIPSRGKLDWQAIRALRQLAFSTAVDVVHAHGYKADVFVYLALRRSKLPYVATCHNWLDNDRKSRVYGYVDRRILSGYSRIAAVSEEVQGRLQGSGVNPAQIELIRNGIDVRPFRLESPKSQGEDGGRVNLVVGFVGRLSWEKGPDIFIRAAGEVLRQYDRVEFALAGEGPELSGLQILIDELGIRPKIHLLRHVKDMACLYHDFDLMVSSSRREGLPIAVLEAMASSLPVIATSVGDVPKVISHGRTGMLIPPEDPRLLAQAILELLEDAPRRSQLGAAASRFINEAFSLDRMAKEYFQLYGKAISIAHES
jgi:glycosyltransferase involved in cell wall biosynthesis